uniref:Pectinesterase inhibitor domain-containing protein n=1 Tax=Oryza meridionalis TaxID=40149 RepID=A0A0E0E9L1_9ORYZ
MAMARSQLAAVFLAVLVSVAPLAGAADNLQDACNRTLFPKVCIQALTTNPESRTANARRLAELSVYVAAEVGTAVAAFAHHELNGVKEDALFKCVDSCSDDIEEAVAHLSALTRELTDAKFLEVKAWLSATLGGSSTCEDTCKDAPISEIKNAVVTKSLEFEKLLRVTLDLITEASGSMSADVAVPPAAGAGAAGYGYESSSAAAAPAPSESDSDVGSGSAASAPGPSPSDDTGYGGSGGSSGSSSGSPSSSPSSSPSGSPSGSPSSSPSGSPAGSPSGSPAGSPAGGPAAGAPAPGPSSYGAASGPAEGPSSSGAAGPAEGPSSSGAAGPAEGPSSYGSTEGPSPSPSSSGSADAPGPGASAPDSEEY